MGYPTPWSSCTCLDPCSASFFGILLSQTWRSKQAAGTTPAAVAGALSRFPGDRSKAPAAEKAGQRGPAGERGGVPDRSRLGHVNDRCGVCSLFRRRRGSSGEVLSRTYLPLGQAGGRDRIAGVNRRWCSEQFVTERPCSRFREKPASQILQFEGHERLRVLSPWVNAVFGMVLGIRKVWHQKGRSVNPSNPTSGPAPGRRTVGPVSQGVWSLSKTIV